MKIYFSEWTPIEIDDKEQIQELKIALAELNNEFESINNLGFSASINAMLNNMQEWGENLKKIIHDVSIIISNNLANAFKRMLVDGQNFAKSMSNFLLTWQGLLLTTLLK